MPLIHAVITLAGSWLAGLVISGLCSGLWVKTAQWFWWKCSLTWSVSAWGLLITICDMWGALTPWFEPMAAQRDTRGAGALAAALLSPPSFLDLSSTVLNCPPLGHWPWPDPAQSVSDTSRASRASAPVTGSTGTHRPLFTTKVWYEIAEGNEQRPPGSWGWGVAGAEVAWSNR